MVVVHQVDPRVRATNAPIRPRGPTCRGLVIHWHAASRLRQYRSLEATEDYFVTEDALSAWIEECCDLVKAFNSLTRELYPDYKAWAKTANEYVLSEKRFTNALLNMGFTPWRQPQTKRHGFCGIALRASNEELPM
jgi:phage/plasmid-associated DNA primase